MKAVPLSGGVAAPQLSLRPIRRGTPGGYPRGPDSARILKMLCKRVKPALGNPLPLVKNQDWEVNGLSNGRVMAKMLWVRVQVPPPPIFPPSSSSGVDLVFRGRSRHSRLRLFKRNPRIKKTVLRARPMPGSDPKRSFLAKPAYPALIPQRKTNIRVLASQPLVLIAGAWSIRTNNPGRDRGN